MSDSVKIAVYLIVVVICIVLNLILYQLIQDKLETSLLLRNSELIAEQAKIDTRISDYVRSLLDENRKILDSNREILLRLDKK